jgi:hypothetical protein
MGPVGIPGGRAFEKLPLPVTKNGLPQKRKKPVVEGVHVLINWLVWASAEMR